MQLLAWTIVLTSQGIPFLFEGTGLLSSKHGIDNSFQSGDSVNAIEWGKEKARLRDVEYLKELIKLRREHPAFRMSTAVQVAKDIHFEPAPAGCIVYTLNGADVHDSWRKIWVVLNGTGEGQKMPIPRGYQAGFGVVKDALMPTADPSVTVPAYGAVIFYH